MMSDVVKIAKSVNSTKITDINTQKSLETSIGFDLKFGQGFLEIPEAAVDESQNEMKAENLLRINQMITEENCRLKLKICEYEEMIKENFTPKFGVHKNEECSEGCRLVWPGDEMSQFDTHSSSGALEKSMYKSSFISQKSYRSLVDYPLHLRALLTSVNFLNL